MSAGTLKLTNNSTSVVGTSTLFTTDLKPGDFIVTTIGGVLYTLPVDTVTSNTAATLISPFTGPTTTGAAWAAVPRKTMNQVTAELVNQSTAAIRALLAEKGNWMNFYTAPGDISIQPGDSAPAVSGPGWQKMAELVNSSQQWRGSLPANANLNGYGPVQNFVGSWGMETTAGAQPANGFPETNAAGLLEVFAGGQFGGTQRYTTTGGRVYVRTLTAAWNGTDGPWSTWVQVGRELVPISQGGTGATTQAAALTALLGNSAIPVANGGTGGTTQATARTGLGLGNSSTRNVGTAAGTVAAGDDSRLGTIDGKSGGTISGSTIVSGYLRITQPAPQSPATGGNYQGWNTINGQSEYVNHRAGGQGGHKFTIVNPDFTLQAAFTLSPDGNGYAGNGQWVSATSSRATKDSIKEIENPREKMRLIKAATWVYKSKAMSGKFGIGVIADELYEAFPEARITVGNVELDDGSIVEDALSVQAGDSGVTAALHHATILSLINENESQQVEIEELKSNLEELKKIVDQLIAN